MKSYFFYTILFSLLFIASCKPKVEKKAGLKALARVNDEYLYVEDIRNIVPVGTASKDSVEILSNYIDNWIRETLVIQKAEENLTEEQKDVEEQLVNYRNSLITYAYEKELVKQKLDTVVSINEIEEYYDTNKDNFELKDNIIKVIYVKVRKDAPGIKDLQGWYKSNDIKEREKLADYCHQFAENYYLNDNTWFLFDEILKEIPITTYDKQSFLRNNRFVEVSDSLYNYYMHIKGFKVQNSRSPLSFESENIRNIILNKRKLKLITKMRMDVYNDAVNRKRIEIF